MPGKRPDPMTRWYMVALPTAAVCALFGFLAGMVIRGLIWMTSPEMPVGGLPYLMAFLFGGGAFVVLAISSGAGEFMRRIMTGGPMRPTPQYSYADSLVARGRYEDAIAAYRDAIREEAEDGPVDAEPYLRIARVYRDHLKQPEDAIRWFREARRASGATRGQINAATCEIVDIHVHGGGDPPRAIPELARLADEAAGSKVGDWAARKLAALKEELAWTIKDQASAAGPTEQDGPGQKGVGNG